MPQRERLMALMMELVRIRFLFEPHLHDTILYMSRGSWESSQYASVVFAVVFLTSYPPSPIFFVLSTTTPPTEACRFSHSCLAGASFWNGFPKKTTVFFLREKHQQSVPFHQDTKELLAPKFCRGMAVSSPKMSDVFLNFPIGVCVQNGFTANHHDVWCLGVFFGPGKRVMDWDGCAGNETFPFLSALIPLRTRKGKSKFKLF